MACLGAPKWKFGTKYSIAMKPVEQGGILPLSGMTKVFTGMSLFDRLSYNVIALDRGGEAPLESSHQEVFE